MPQTATLSSMLEDLALETGETTNPTARTHVRSRNIRLLQRHQRQLWKSFDWPFLRVWRDINLQKNQSRYAYPPDLDLERVEGPWVTYGDRQWVGLLRMLEPPDYAYFDTDEGENFNPQLRWFPRENNEFEVWPAPSDNDQILRFVGIKTLDEFTDDDHTSTLDADMIILFAAAEILARRGAKDANLIASQAQQRFNQEKKRLAPKHGFTFNGQPESAGGNRKPFGPKPVDFA